MKNMAQYSVLRNLWGGFCLAFFFPIKDGVFRISWPLLMLAPVISALIQFGIDYRFNYNEEEVYSHWYGFHLHMFFLVLACSFWVASLYKSYDLILDVAVRLYYGVITLLTFEFVLSAMPSEWIGEEKKEFIDALQLIWGFLILFRIVAIVFPPFVSKQIFSAAAMPLVIWVAKEQMYFSHFYFPPEEEVIVEQTAYQKLKDEQVFEMQDSLLEGVLSKIEKSKKGEVDLYGLGFASFGYQDVFMRELDYIEQRMKSRLMISDSKVLTLNNNEDTVFKKPMATVTNLRSSLKKLAEKMQKDEDILLLYVTSHGWPDHISVHMDDDRSLLDLSAGNLADMLDDSGIKNRIIILSACFSGSMMKPLQNPNTLIITSAANNRQSYGCSEDSEMTYFSHAFFVLAMEQTTDFVDAFKIAEHRVSDRERREELPTESKPQIYIGKNILQAMSKYKSVPISAEP